MCDHDAVAEQIREAMDGWGSDEAALTDLITAYSNEDLQWVRKAYEAKYEKDLIKDIKSECSGLYEDFLVALLYTPAECDAFWLGKAIVGAGTEEESIIEHLVNRTGNELDAIEAAYEQLHGKTLKDAIEGDLGGDNKDFFVTLVTSRRTDEYPSEGVLGPLCEQLYEAGEGKWGTDEGTIINIIATKEPKFVVKLNKAYEERYGKTLVSAVEEEMGGMVAKAIDAMASGHDVYYAYLIKQSAAGGTDEERLVRILTSRRNQLRAINAKFIESYELSLFERLEEECSGELKRVICNLVKDL